MLNTLRGSPVMDILMYNREILNITEIIKNRLFFAVVNSNVRLKNTSDIFFFNTDNEFVYLNYYYDFGPLNLSCLYKYCCKVNEYLHASKKRRIVHVTSEEPHLKANAAFLIGCYVVAYLHVSPRDITKALISGCSNFLPFADASQGGSEWKITLIDCFSAIYKAYHLRFFNFDDFDVLEYDTFDKLVNGDLNWLLPKKFLAFIGPTDIEYVNFHSPDFYIQYFLKNNVKAVIRLNNVMYNAAIFNSVGIDHYDLYFPDGTTPPKKILLDFLAIAERTQGALAVHCKAGLGRTGSLIGAYIIKHYRFTAREAIAWLRICRPGSVIGQQQGWLEHMENWLWRQGNIYRHELFGDYDKIKKHKHGIYSLQWKKERSEYFRRQKDADKEQRTPAKVSKTTSMKHIEKPKKDMSVSNLKHPKTGVPKPNNTKLYDHHNSMSKVYDFQYHSNSSKSTTQGDKLNMIKLNKHPQHNSSFVSNLNIVMPTKKQR